MKPTNIQRIVQSLETERTNIETRWTSVERYILPFRGRFYTKDMGEQTIDWRNRWAFDSTAIDAAVKLANSMHGSLTSNMVRWFSIVFRDNELNQDKASNVWIQQCTNIIWLALRESNFNVVAPEAYADLVGFGNAAIVEEIDGSIEEFKGLIFGCIPIRECFFEQDHLERVKRFYRILHWTPLQIIDKFGDATPDWILEKANNPNTAVERIKIIYAIWRRDEVDPDVDTSKLLAPELRPYGTRYVCYENAETLGKEDGAYEMPAFVLRWAKDAASKWGHSPAMVALPDVLTLNALVELTLRAAEKAVDPPNLVVDAKVEGQLDLRPGGETPVHDVNAIKPYVSGSRIDVAYMDQDRLKDNIRKMFHVHELELKESPAMTATEVSVRYELLQKLLGTTLGRLQNDFLNPMIQRTFAILFRAGQLPPVPDMVRERQAQFDIEYIGPLSRSQKSDEVANTERYLATIAQYAEIWPEVTDVVDATKALMQLGSTLQVAAEIMRNTEEIEARRKQRAREEQEAKDFAQAEAAAKIARDIAPAAAQFGQGEGAPATEMPPGEMMQ